MTIQLLDERVFGRLKVQAKDRTYAHTYLFTGEELEKKRALAVAFARALNCSETPFDLDCRCPNCAKIEAGTHPDVKWYGLDPDAASIKIAEVRDFKNWLSLKPYQGKAKVFIFDGADRLTAEGQNALLKSLEEPPPGNVILLLVERARSLFDTIVSRAVEIRVPCFSSEELEKILIREGVDSKEATFLCRVSGGNLTCARRAREEQWYRLRSEWLRRLVENPVSFLEQFHNANRKEVVNVLYFLAELMRDVLTFSVLRDERFVIHAGFGPTIGKLATAKRFDFVLELFHDCVELAKAAEDNANTKLTLSRAEILFCRFLRK